LGPAPFSCWWCSPPGVTRKGGAPALLLRPSAPVASAPRRATRRAQPRLRYRLNNSRPFASAPTGVEQGRHPGTGVQVYRHRRSRWHAPAGSGQRPHRRAPGQRAPGRSFVLGAVRAVGTRPLRSHTCGSRFFRPSAHRVDIASVRRQVRGETPALHSVRALPSVAQAAAGRRRSLRSRVRFSLTAFAASQLPFHFGCPSAVNGLCSRASPAGGAPGPAPPFGRSTDLPGPDHLSPRAAEGGGGPQRREPVMKRDPVVVRSPRPHWPETRRIGRSPRGGWFPQGGWSGPRQ